MLVIQVTCKIFLINSICTKLVLHKKFLHENLLNEQKQTTGVIKQSTVFIWFGIGGKDFCITINQCVKSVKPGPYSRVQGQRH